MIATNCDNDGNSESYGDSVPMEVAARLVLRSAFTIYDNCRHARHELMMQ